MAMIRKLISTLAVFQLATLAFAEYAIPPPLSDPDNQGDWAINPSVSDEFNGSDFDRSVWYNQGENGEWNGQWKGRAPSQYNPDNVAVRDGFLYMTARWQPDFAFANEGGAGNSVSNIKYGQIAPVTAAALLGKNSFHYGYMEMRSKAADGPISSSYWTTGGGGETDAFESYGWNPNKRWSEKRFHTSFHDWRKGSKTLGKRIWENDHILDFRVADDFHTYGFEWDMNYIAIYIDGNMIRCTTREEMGDKWVAINPQRPWIDMETFDWEVKPQDLRAEHFNGSKGIDFVVDYARVYQRRNGAVGLGCPEQKNLLHNPGFEDGKSGWRGAESIITSSTNSGSNALALNSGGTVEQVVAVEPNTTYLLSAAASSPNTNEKDRWYNAYLGVRNTGSSSQIDTRYFAPRWQQKSLQFTTDENTTEVTVYFTNLPQAQPAWLDDVVLTKLEQPGGNH